MKHVIYPTLSEKTMVMKVPLAYLFLNLIVLLFFWITIESLILAVVVGFAVWVAGVVYSKADPDFAEIILSKRLKLSCSTLTPNEKGNRYIS